ncbi:nuclear transport factor 2 family protein [Sphingomonas paeninsulae]|jgi:ketosteroid isomerase-like protein|uniref:Nuclear transport factor 2 family protein n=1 Tax=Sphingomonas paeninsulae TaxID=2319844 RepID=A0A494TI81_SPHPE|nr:nuclear transport factor 2 family protein [Sphingomonas paeninsulae]AYJ87032.1 nuclear transport factor 2 family protein [Sphingomonas paeninsulae]
MSVDAEALQDLIDKEAIRTLISAYCNAADRHDHVKMRSLYHEDAIDDHGAMSSGPAMDFIDRLPEIQASMEILHHNVTTINIAIDGDYAEGEVYLLALHRVKGPDGPFDVLVGGRYFDKYERRDGKWKFAHRAIVADWANIHSPSIVDLNHPFLTGAHIGKPGLADPSYDFFRLLGRGA